MALVRNDFFVNWLSLAVALVCNSVKSVSCLCALFCFGYVDIRAFLTPSFIFLTRLEPPSAANMERELALHWS